MVSRCIFVQSSNQLHLASIQMPVLFNIYEPVFQVFDKSYVGA